MAHADANDEIKSFWYLVTVPCGFEIFVRTRIMKGIGMGQAAFFSRVNGWEERGQVVIHIPVRASGPLPIGASKGRHSGGRDEGGS
jgi:hypothetical protein